MPNVTANVQNNQQKIACLVGKLDQRAPNMIFFPKGSSSAGQEALEFDRVTRFALFLPICLVTLVASPASAEPQPSTPSAFSAGPAFPCIPARAGVHVATLPDAWRTAVATLLASTSSPDLPWGCVGGEVDLVVDGSSGTLTVTDAQGNAVSREVASPDDVAPLGEALLAKPLLPPEAPASETPTPTEPATTASPTEKLPPPKLPRLLVAASPGARYASPGHFLLASFTLQALVPLRSWAPGIWIRVDGVSRALDHFVPPTRELCLGGIASWSMTAGRLQFRPMLKPSLAVVTREIRLNRPPSGVPNEFPESIIINDTAFDFRVGADLQLVMSLTQRVRAVASVDAEVSPAQAFSKQEMNRAGQTLAHVPTLTAGVGLGVEVVVP